MIKLLNLFTNKLVFVEYKISKLLFEQRKIRFRVRIEPIPFIYRIKKRVVTIITYDNSFISENIIDKFF